MAFTRIAVASLAIMLVSACSNNNDSRKGTGFNSFLHLVTDAAQLQLEGDKRNYGELRYEQAGALIDLQEGSHKADLVEKDQQNSVNDNILVPNISFGTAENRTRLHVLNGSIAANNIELNTIVLARDKDLAENDNELAEIFINITHLYRGGQALEVSLTDDAGNTQTVSLNYGETSDDIMLTRQTQTLIVSASGVELYNSGEQTINDALEQGIVLADYAGLSGNGLSAYYYSPSYIAGVETWRDQSVGETGLVKVVNALIDVTGDTPVYHDVTASIVKLGDSSEVVAPFTAVYGETGEYNTPLETGNYTLDITAPTPYSYIFNVGADTAYTLYALGLLDDRGITSNPVILKDDKRALTNFASLQIVHLASSVDADVSSQIVDVHVLYDDQRPTATTLLASGLAVGGNASVYVNSPVAGRAYTLMILPTGDYDSFLAKYAFVSSADYGELEAGDARQLVFYRNVSPIYNIKEVTKDTP